MAGIVHTPVFFNRFFGLQVYYTCMNLSVTYIKSRRSVRKYKETPVPKEAIHDALECARLAPTARNAQPWQIGVVTDRDTLEKLGELASHGKFIADAAVCFAVFSESEHKFCVEDGCAATMQIIFGLLSHGVYSCWVAGNNMDYAEDVRKLLNVPEKYSLISLIPAGYPADITIPEKKVIDDIVFYEEWKE